MAPPRKPLTPKGEATRRHIIDTATGVFAQLGYDKARMADLVTATGLTKGAVYFHFDSKEALALAVLSAKQERWLDAVRSRLAARPAGLARLLALLPAMLDLHDGDPDAWAISRLTSNLAEISSTRPVAVESTRGWIAFVADLIRDAQATGEVRADADPTLIATTLVAAFDGLKATVAVLAAPGEKRQAELARHGRVLEEMMLAYLGT